MAPFSANRHRDFSAGDVKKEWELGDWRSVPPLSLDDLFDDPAIRQCVGKLIGKAVPRDF